MKYNEENIDKVAQYIVDNMDLGEVMAYVYDDIYEIMLKDEEMFDTNVEAYDLGEE
jgi:hypothetical protein